MGLKSPRRWFDSTSGHIFIGLQLAYLAENGR
jgi:hypothetical protein